MQNRPENENGIEPEGETVKPVEPENAQALTEEPKAEEEPRRKGIAAVLREAFERAKHGKHAEVSRKSNAAGSDRATRNRDRTKTLFVCVGALVGVFLIFLAIFSSSHTSSKQEQAGKRNPSLGQPQGQEQRRAGSVTPLLSAEMSGQSAGNEQLTPEDINNTARPRESGEATPAGPPNAGATGANRALALSNVPFTDPALEAYRQRLESAPGETMSSRPAAKETPPAGTAPANPESAALSKASLVYVRTNSNRGASSTSGAPTVSAAASAEPAFLNRGVWSGLPAGTRLVARLQTAVSTAVKAPVVAVIETHYERDGEIVVPAGTKVLGELESSTQSGYVGISFASLHMPDGSTEKIEAGAMSLNFGPLKGQVSGKNRGKQFLARALTGVGSVAAFVVGSPGGLTGPVDNSILLRNRISQNIGMAGDQEVMRLAYSQEIVVTVPGNTRFFIVLQQGSGREAARSQQAPAGSSGKLAVAANSERLELPTAAELRELLSLKQELNRMYREVSATRTAAPAGAQ